MSEGGVGTQPLPENVDGVVSESHQWVHSVEHSIRWDYALAILLGLLVLWFWYDSVRSSSDNSSQYQ